jgi:ABC-type multidrug transport system fused ATPase/permease subunit
VVILLAALRIEQGVLSPGDLVIFVTYTRTFARPLRRVSKLSEQTARTSAAAERLLEVLEQVPEIRDEPRAFAAPRLNGQIDLEGVSFGYGSGKQVLDRVSLRVRAGERVGIVGPTGVGKSTLISLVPRFQDPTAGRVLIDRLPVRSLTLASLRAQVSVVFQEPLLFAGTIAENIAYGRPGATREEIRRAADEVGIGEVIERLPEGFDTLIGERGGTLSGGERQCVAIARALIRDAPIVLLDEPTTGLDPRSAAMVLEAIRELVRGRTVLFVTHQLEQLRDADRIVVLEAGRIVQDGSYADVASGPASSAGFRPLTEAVDEHLA